MNRDISDGKVNGVRNVQKVSDWVKNLSSGFSRLAPRASEPSIEEETEVAVSKGQR